MRKLAFFLCLFFGSQLQAQTLAAPDAIRVREFYRLESQIAEKVWTGWSTTPDSLLLVTEDTEYLTHHPHPPADFTKIDQDWSARKRQFPTSLLATFPAFGPLSVIVIGEPASTTAKTSTPWIATLFHEHFHQLQDSQPGSFDAVKKLGLDHGDTSGMWMLNYPFPYDKPEVVKSFDALRQLLLETLDEPDGHRFQILARHYAAERRRFFAALTTDDGKYFEFQLWKEGIARYVEIRSAEAAKEYKPTAEYAALPDYESFADYASKVRKNTAEELRQADIAKWKRTVVYSFGAGEGLLLDRLNPAWRQTYFSHGFTLAPYFTR